jgi:hypothetical protein
VFDISELIGGDDQINDNMEVLLKVINGEDGDRGVETERQGEPKQSKAAPATTSIDVIKQRYQAVHSRISNLGLYPHPDVSKVAYSLLKTWFGDKSFDDQIPQLDKQLSALEVYLNSANVQMTEIDEGSSQGHGGELEAGPPAAPIDTRFNIFRDIALGLCTTPRFSGRVPLSDFVEMVNSNIMDNREFNEGEAAVFFAQMSQLREVRWDQSRKTVRPEHLLTTLGRLVEYVYERSVGLLLVSL